MFDLCIIMNVSPSRTARLETEKRLGFHPRRAEDARDGRSQVRLMC